MPASASPASPKTSTTDARPQGPAETVAATAGPARQALLYLVAVLAFVLDRVTKALVRRNLTLDGPHAVVGRLVYLTHTQNTGAAFSFGVSFGTFFMLLAAAVSAGIIVYNRRIPAGDVWLRVGLGLIMGGALGNALDRAVSGSVTDFIDLRWWPVFNLADSSIVVGAVISSLRLSARPERDPGLTG